MVRAYNTTIAANGVLRIANAGGRVRESFSSGWLFDPLSAGAEPGVEDAVAV